MDIYKDYAEKLIGQITDKMAWVSEKNKDKIPYTTEEDGSYDDRLDAKKQWGEGDGPDWWTNGFWGGILWLMYQATGEAKYMEIARVSEYRLEERLQEFNGLHHDVGFMFRLTAAADYDLTGSLRSKKTALHAANLLAGRFNPAGEFIRAWNDGDKEDTRGWAIIDCMMNLSLLYWASEAGNDPRFRHIAMAHADTAMEQFVRPDGSVSHIVEFDPETGEALRSIGGQGYAEGSSWSRGQGWAVYGFMISYEHTGKKEYLDTARKVADYCIANLAPDGIVPVDFRQPAEPAWEDSCGACVIAGGLLRVAECVPEAEQAYYREPAFRILHAVAEERADWSRDCDAIVQNCSPAYHDSRHDMTMVYADYYFIESVYRLAGRKFPMW